MQNTQAGMLIWGARGTRTSSNGFVEFSIISPGSATIEPYQNPQLT